MKCVFNALPISDDDFNHRDFEGTTISGLSGFSASAVQWLDGGGWGGGGAFETRRGRMKAKGTKGVSRVSWLSPLFVGFVFQSLLHERLIRKKRGQTPSLAFLFAIRRQPSASTRIPK
jgi:hypothetical protein